MHLLTSEEAEMDSTGGYDGARLKAALAPAIPFLQWWLREIKACLPQALRKLFTERRLLVRASPREFCIADPHSPERAEVCHALRSWSRNGDAGSPPSATQRCDLLLDKGMVLERELELPLDAETTLRRVLSFSMDRYTPFNESDVLFDYKVVRRDSANRKLALKLYVAPREALEPLLGNLAGMGLEVASLDVAADTANSRTGVNLLAAERRSANAGMGRIDRALLFSGVALLLVALVSPFVLRHQSAARLEDELAQLRAEVREAETVRMELTERIERMRLIQSRNTAMPATLDILLELTRLIPDDAWAGQVAVKSGRVRLTGEASAASELLALLSNSAIFSDPKFEAPLTQNPRTGRERFVISLAIKGMHDEG
jgi:general secretion pathway protein L